ncbi:MAG: galactitol-1-phosphate 5-dehydrogenase [Firmicutes bacterium]|jgi:L-iditol 2-dehydrogenase|nr:galactitol-1-phosphate 5-dehydrogenase [Bacillota bacterium]
MKALVFHGPLQMRWEDVPDPTLKDGEVLVKVKAVGICGSDIHGYQGKTKRRIPPMVMGHEAAGEVAALGPKANKFAVGQGVIIQPLMGCGDCPACDQGAINQCSGRSLLGVNAPGAMAEYVVVREQNLYPLPQGVSYSAATMAEPMSVVAHALSRTPSLLHQKVAIIGAGAIGLLAVMMVRAGGALQLLAVDLSDYRLGLAKELGADVVINSGREDAAKVIREMTGGGADIIIECVGVAPAVQTAIYAVRNGGHITLIGNSAAMMELPEQELVVRELTAVGTYAFNREFPVMVEALGKGSLPVDKLISLEAPLEEGAEVFAKLGQQEDERVIKAVLCG